jgi:hypothetical protein
MLKETKQTLRKCKIAAYNQMLHKNSICPGNHEVNYYNSWYYFDGNAEQRPEITRKAKEAWNNFRKVYYSETYNTYVFE